LKDLNSIINIPIRKVDFITKEPLVFDKKTKEATIIKNGEYTYINDKKALSPISVFSEKNKMIKINDRFYFGTITIYPESSITVINSIPIETYLLSVLPSEIPATFKIEAMKAQAVIARTYSIYFLRKNVDNNFDVDDSTNYQVYKGFNNVEDKYLKNIFSAVKSTEGKIITYNDEPIIAYFHSNSGGKLKSGLEYFGKNSDYPYLAAKDDPYSIDSPGYNWTYDLSMDQYKTLFKTDSNLSYDAISFNDSGYADKIKIDNAEYNSKLFRKTVGYAKLKSETFKIEILDDKIIFNGYGYGHGVGMSQWGANSMAKQNFDYKDIIEFYYPNTELGYY
jgi:stage II sporulation protein D